MGKPAPHDATVHSGSLHSVGHAAVRIDGKAKITGCAPFVDDMEFGSALLHAAIVESPHAHAIIRSIDTSRAAALSGVVRVVTGHDLPFTFGLFVRDRPVLARDRVRFAGEAVAAVVARDAVTAARGAKLVRVQYEELPPVLDVGAALASDSVLLHPELDTYPHAPWVHPSAHTNVGHWLKVRRGDVTQGFGEAEVVIEDTYTMPRCAHCALEPHGAVGLCDFAGRLTMWTSSQSPYLQRGLFAQALAPLGFRHRDVRVITPFVGGGFGGKAGATMEILAAALATTVRGRPVRLLWSREQEFRSTYQRPGVVAHVKLGFRRDGTLLALQHRLHWDSGAYVEYGVAVVNTSGLGASGPYRIPHLDIEALCLYTSLPPTGPFRGFGHPQALFGLECQMDEGARRLGIDPVEIRRRNHIRAGDPLPHGAEMHACGLAECIERVAREIQWGRKEAEKSPDLATGQGFALFWKGALMPPNASSSALLRMDGDGSVHLLVSAVEIGQGVYVAMAQIAAEILTVPVERIRVETSDTDRSPYEWQTVASHITWGTGNAVLRAALDARDQVFERVARACGVERESLLIEAEAVRSRTDPSFMLPLSDIVSTGVVGDLGTVPGGPIVGRGTFMSETSSLRADPGTGQGSQPIAHFTVGAAAVNVVVDRQTGRVTVHKAVLAIDVGRAINKGTLRDQLTGGLVQGLGTALFEELRYDGQGVLQNDNLGDYKIPTALDIPRTVVPIIVEVPQPDGPFGARGAGEHPTIPAAPMIANAVRDALGVRIKSAPITAEKIALTMLEIGTP